MKHPILNEAQNAVINFSASAQNRYDALAREKGLRDYNSRFYAAKEEGIEIGISKGRAEGKAEGKAEGEQIGVSKANLAMALKLIAKGFSLPEISDVTGISEEELQKLLNS
jgi:predicted transposase/invertase (TIGR01784 family)